MKPDHILLVPGIFNFRWYWNGWQKDLRAVYPDAEIELLQWWYFCVPARRVEHFISRVAHEVDTRDGNILLLAHSFGGLVSKAAAEQTSKSPRELRIVTMSTPHSRNFRTWLFGAEWTKNRLQIPLKSPFVVQSIGGTRDIIVSAKIARHEGGGYNSLPTSHLGIMLSHTMRQKILQKLSYIFLGRR